MNYRRFAITLVVTLSLLTAGTGAVSAADAGTDKCMPAQDVPTTDSGAGAQGCTPPPCAYLCDDVRANDRVNDGGPSGGHLA
ncbi:hypothetical protein [Halorussus halobius]|uniref:hypothetical protein n=1 Tax=Halorussus halobius TaxID=1710537 RepID=UPI0010930BA3|nr:hypothetical protein [Halorussus halobius]